ncbi:MAG: transglutaminase family protein [Cyanobacteria bacterium J06600_6]
MQEYLAETDIVDYQHPDIQQLALKLSESGSETTAKNCFDWVRDNIRHSSDYQQNPVTCRASAVLQHKTGYCFAKSHLLAALLRANSIPTGFCYQRLSVFDDGAPYSLHGFNAVYLDAYGWYRLDAQGNKPGVDAQFTPPIERLAYEINLPDELDCPYVFAEPLSVVVQTLQNYPTWDEMLGNLPDFKQEDFSKFTSLPKVSTNIN